MFSSLFSLLRFSFCAGLLTLLCFSQAAWAESPEEPATPFRPHLLYLDTAVSVLDISERQSPGVPSAQLGYLFHPTPQLGWGVFGGYDLINLQEGMGFFPGGVPRIGLNARYYFTPNPWSFFIDGGVRVHPFTLVVPEFAEFTTFHLRPGIAYRGTKGFNAGAFIDLQTATRNPVGLGAYIGYAFH